MDEDGIYRTAGRLIDQYGTGAVFQAALRAGKSLEHGDLEGAATWERIIQAIYDLRSAEGETRH
jgi:hypothetical protein